MSLSGYAPMVTPPTLSLWTGRPIAHMEAFREEFKKDQTCSCGEISVSQPIWLSQLLMSLLDNTEWSEIPSLVSNPKSTLNTQLIFTAQVRSVFQVRPASFISLSSISVGYITQVPLLNYFWTPILLLCYLQFINPGKFLETVITYKNTFKSKLLA